MNQATQLAIAVFSMGCALSVRVTERHPERVTGFILLNPALLDSHGFMRRGIRSPNSFATLGRVCHRPTNRFYCHE